MSKIVIPKYNIQRQYLDYLNEIKSKEKKLFERTIFEHFEGCYNILNSWDYSKSICIFGLFHSVYEKSVFEKNPPNHLNREKLRSVVGEDLEKLIFKWNTIKRKEYINEIIENSEKQIKEDPIVVMIWANIFEQAINRDIPTEGKVIFSKTAHLVNKRANLTFKKLLKVGLII